MQKLIEIIVFILSIPLMLFQIIIYICEEIQLKNNKLRDRLFMKRFNLINDKHVRDFVDWSISYKEKRDHESIG